jgi:putative transposase
MAREIGASTLTIYSWKAKYGGVEPNEAVRLHHLEDENSRSGWCRI